MKFKFLFIFFVFSLIAMLSSKSYAQTYKSIPFFDVSKPVTTFSIKEKDLKTSDVHISLPPITTITVRQGSFTQDVSVTIYKGIWEVLTAGPNKGNSPIASYYLVFEDSSGKELVPTKILEVHVYNNYGGTKATYTPLKRNTGAPDSTGIVVFPNQTSVKAILSQNNTGFIVSVNKEMKEDDPSLTMEQNVATSPFTTTPSKTDRGSVLNQNLIVILALVVVLILIGALTIYLFLKSGRKNSQT